MGEARIGHALRLRRASVLTRVAAVAALLVGAADRSNAANNPPSNPPAATGMDVSGAKAAVAAAERPVGEITPNGGSFSAFPTARGKVVGMVAGDTVSAVFQQMFKEFRRAAAVLGIEVKLCDGQQYKVAEISRCIGRFKAAKVDAIVLQAIDPSLIQGPLREAKGAGLRVIANNTATEGAPLAANVDAQVAYPYVAAAELEAQAVAAMADGSAKILVITSSEYVNSPPMERKIKETFSRTCGSACQVITRDVPIADWERRLAPLVQSTVQSDRGIDYVIPLFDGEVAPVLAGLRSASAAGRVRVVSFNGTQGVVDFVAQPGNPFAADVGAWPEQLGWATADAAARLFAGQRDNAALRDSKISPRIFDKADIGSIDLSRPNSWYGSLDLEKYYRKQWQMQ